MMEDYAAYAKRYKAFCDENRLRIIALLQDGELCACELLKDLQMGQSTLSYHMKLLCEAGIVENRQDGKWAHYRISAQGSADAIRFLQALTTPRNHADACRSGCVCEVK